MKHPLLIALIFFALPTILPAQTDTTAAIPDDDSVPGTWTIVASGGWTFPVEPPEFSDHFKTNYNFGGGIAYAMSPGEVGYGEVSLLLHYYNVLFTRSGFRESNGLAAGAGIFGYPGDVFTGMVQFRGVYGAAKGSIAPYFTAGVGVFHVALPERGLTTPPTLLFEEYKKTTFGWSVGLGVDVPVMERITLFVDGRFLLGVSGTSGTKLFSGGGGIRYEM